MGKEEFRLQKHLQLAEELNQQFVSPSDCFDWVNLPVCWRFMLVNDVISNEIYELCITNYCRLQNLGAVANMQLQYVESPEDFINKDLRETKLPSMLICSEKFLLELLKDYDELRAKPDYVLVIDWFLTNEDSKCVMNFKDPFNPGSIFSIGKKLRNFDDVVCYDDDMISAAEAALLFKRLEKTFGQRGPNGHTRRLLCVGGKGPASSFLYSKSEAEKQKETLQFLGIDERDIVVVNGGNNTGENLTAMEKVIGKRSAVVAVTQRLSLILRHSAVWQKPGLHLSGYTIYQTVKETCRLYNGMALHHNRAILHFWAHVVPRCKRYAGKFMTEVEGITPELEAASQRLEANYKIKLPGFAIKTILQYYPILKDLRRKKKTGEFNRDMSTMIKFYQDRLLIM